MLRASALHQVASSLSLAGAFTLCLASDNTVLAVDTKLLVRSMSSARRFLAFGAVAISSAAGDGRGGADRLAGAGLSSASSSEQSSPRGDRARGREEAERGREEGERGREEEREEVEGE